MKKTLLLFIAIFCLFNIYAQIGSSKSAIMSEYPNGAPDKRDSAANLYTTYCVNLENGFVTFRFNGSDICYWYIIVFKNQTIIDEFLAINREKYIKIDDNHWYYFVDNHYVWVTYLFWDGQYQMVHNCLDKYNKE